jgi:hypothetical protein
MVPLKGNHAQQMKGVGVAGMGGQDLAIDLPGFGEPPVAMVLKRGIHQALKRLVLLGQRAVLLPVDADAGEISRSV